MRTLSLVLIAASCAAGSVAAQVQGLPVVNNGVPVGINLAADIGFANADAGKGTTLGGSAAIGLGFVGLGGAIARTSPENGGDMWSQAVSASLNILGGPLVPIRVTVMGGMGWWEVAGIKTTRYPVSLGLSATIPIPALSIKPWLAPRVERIETTGLDAENHFGLAGGIELAMLNGLSIRASYDRLFVDNFKPGILSLGVGFAP